MVGKIQDMGALAVTKERKVVEFKEYVVYVLRGFPTFHVMVGVGVYGDHIGEAIRKQSSSMRGALFRRGIRVHLAPQLAKLVPIGSWGSKGELFHPSRHLCAHIPSRGVKKVWNHCGHPTRSREMKDI